VAPKIIERNAKSGISRKLNANKIKGCAGKECLGKGEVESSILSCSTINMLKVKGNTLCINCLDARRSLWGSIWAARERGLLEYPF
jgi:hypothetical protein